MQTMLVADEGSTIKGDDPAEIFKESERTGVSIAKRLKYLINVKQTTVILPGPALPDLAKRTPRKGR